MQLTNQLAGRKVVEVWKDGASVLIRCEGGYELRIGWRNPETGQSIKGEPVVLSAGMHIMARGMREIVHRAEVGLK